MKLLKIYDKLFITLLLLYILSNKREKLEERRVKRAFSDFKSHRGIWA